MKFLLTVLISLNTFLNAQVGISSLTDDTPMATLDVKALNKDDVADGVLIPRISRDRAKTMTTPEDATLIFINDISNGDMVGKTALVDHPGFYYYQSSSAIWIPIKDTNTDEGELVKIAHGYGTKFRRENASTYYNPVGDKSFDFTLNQNGLVHGADGNYSFAAITSNATGDYALGMGYKSNAEGNRSTAIGGGLARGDKSTALGPVSFASGENAVALSGGRADGKESLAFGGYYDNGIARAHGAIALGHGTIVQPEGYSAVALGYRNNIKGKHSGALGAGLQTNSYCEVAVGGYNQPHAYNAVSNNQYIPNSYAFTVGIGGGEDRRENGFTVWKSGAFAFKKNANIEEGYSIGSSLSQGIHATGKTGVIYYHNGTEWQPYTRLVSVPNSQTSACQKGDIAIDDAYQYFCHQSNLWKRISLDTNW